jgi:RimJ/RimL family protein N-acetyltransferase
MNIKLAHFSENDIPQLIKWVDRPEASDLWASTTYQYPLTKEKVLEHLTKTQKNPLQLIVFKIVNENEETLGHAELDHFDLQSQSARITRVFVDPIYRNKGIAQTATNLLLDYCFKELKLNRVEIFALEKNQIALNLYEQAGFKIDGLLRDNMQLTTGTQSSYALSILKSEYQLQSDTNFLKLPIKKAQIPKDSEKILTLLKELRTELTLPHFIETYKQAHKNDDYQIVFLEEKNEVVALMGYRILYDFVHGKHLYIDDLVTKSDQRSKGYGAKLLTYAEELAAKLNSSGLRLCTGIENEQGKKFYQQNNWQLRAIVYKKKVK